MIRTDDPTPSALAELAAEVDDLRARYAAHHLLDLAVGVLVAQLGLEPQDAARHLEELAAAAGTPATDLAADIVNQAAGQVVSLDLAAVGREARALRRVGARVQVAEELDEVATALVEDGLERFGASGLLLWRASSDGCLALVGGHGCSSLEMSRWRLLPPQLCSLPMEALTESHPLWFPKGPEERGVLPGPSAESARALIPLRARGRTVGLALVLWPGPAPLDESTREQVEGLVSVSARVLDAGRATDYASDRPVLAAVLDLLAHPGMSLWHGDGGEPRVEHLNPTARRVAAPLPSQTGRPLSQLFPYAAAELTELVGEAQRSGSPQRMSRLPTARGRDDPPPLLNVRVLPLSPERSVVLWHLSSRDHSFSLLQSTGRLAGAAAFEDDLLRGVAQWTDQAFALFDLPPEAAPLTLDQLHNLVSPDSRGELDALLETLTDRLEPGTAVLQRPRTDGGVRHIRVIAEPLLTHGTLTGVTGVFQDVSIQHHTEVALAATFDQLTTVQAKADQRHALALQLQRAILPDLPEFDADSGIQVAARYRPAAEEYRVGGDWYDVVRLPDGSLLVAVGDVAGHGIDAATGMVALRNALRGLAVTGHGPARLMHWLNEVALHSPGRPTATCICAVYRPQDRRLRWTSAGHLPPLLLRGGRAELLDHGHSLLLGAVADVRYGEAVTELRPGDRLLLYTDGLIERRHASLDQTLAVLRRTAEHLPEVGLDQQADVLVERSLGDTDDDSSLVLLRIR
ncbi:SpoIIE family protein phosphatase [Streptacidiphilus monticola]|uniref:SpoIIE family protein phosphatase n=1 Tax=Streptacidiphilus monticola TaxID=2161674 RepID=A0ABW1G501_9ACTN